MCGIVGSIGFHINESDLDRIKHRGPDYQELQNTEYEVLPISLGHTRLSIVDLSESGNQPMTTDCGKFSIIFNGEIYNHQQLRDELIKSNFRGHSDTETILYYLKEKGIKGCSEFNGIFAFSFLDRENGKLYLVRDPYGVKPIYFSSLNDNDLLFGSELRVFKEYVSSQINLNSLSELFQFRYVASPDTLLKGVSKLRPGHYLEYCLNNRKYTQDSYLKGCNETVSGISFEEAVEEYGRLFEKAIERQLMSDVEVGLLLSGGIDSALVGFFAQKYADYDLRSFTVGFDIEDDSNELFDARESAKVLGTRHTDVILSKEDFVDSIEEVLRVTEEPLGTTSVIPMYFLNKEVGKQLKVVLTGQGADEPLGGYTRYQGEFIGSKIPRWITNQFIEPIFHRSINEELRRAAYALGDANRLTRFHKIYSLFDESTLKSLIKTKFFHPHPMLSKIEYMHNTLHLEERSSLDAMMILDSHMNLSDDLLNYTDKISMHFGLETRVPILDIELMNFVNSLPASYKLKFKSGKLIHKKFAARVLPGSIVNRKKKGFKSPTNTWFKGDIGNQFREILLEKNGKITNYLNAEAISEIFDMHQKKDYNMEKQIFLLLSLHYWLNENL